MSRETDNKALLDAVAAHTQATTDLIWTLCWLKALCSMTKESGQQAIALERAFHERLHQRRQDRPIFNTLCREVGL
jgi:hypothetical protein